MPGFFGDQAVRLERKFKTVQQLADELFSMFTSDKPMTSDQPIIITRKSNDEPAVQIVDNTDGSSEPIKIESKKGGTNTPAIDPGGYKCCNDGGGGGSGGGSNSTDDNMLKPPPNTSGGPVTLAPPPTGTPYYVFSGKVVISVAKSGDDPYGFNGQTSEFVGAECRPYNPPSIPAPTSGFSIGDIGKKIDNFISRWKLDGYTIVSDQVVGPGRRCQPGETFSDSTVGLPQFP
jgi:hypothetical protein